MRFLQLGYYIVETVPTPDFISLSCSRLLSISECIGEIHPDLSGCFWKHHDKDQKAYKARLQLTDEEFAELKKDVAGLFYDKHLEFDRRFVSLADAIQVYKKYMRNLDHIKVIGISVSESYVDMLKEEIAVNTSFGFTSEIQGNYLGCEILGWDNSSFHSYLCNGLEKDIRQEFTLLVDSEGVIQNSYEETERFANSIKDKGEPVTWVPFALHDCTPAAN